MKLKKLLAFSLAEALITLLIVSLIALASVPVITKKKRMLSNAHGMWMCTLNEQGKAMYYLKNQGTWHVTNLNHCTFLPPRDARNFEFTIVGGGGGGASGSTESNDFILTNGDTKTFTVPGTGTYEIYLIGGGGSGGNRKNNANRCQENPGGPGGSGGYLHTILNLEAGDRYHIKAGNAGKGSNDTGGADGGDSYIKKIGATVGPRLAVATGGRGGQSRRGAACGKRKTDGNKFINGGKCGHAGCPGKAGSPDGEVGWTLGKDGKDTRISIQGVLCGSKTSTKLSGSLAGEKCDDLVTNILESSPMEFIYGPKGSLDTNATTQLGLPYGYGGRGQCTGNTGGPTNGGPGFVRFKYFLVEAGGGGLSGQVSRPAVVPSLKRVIAYPGKGGIGASGTRSNGANGSTTNCTIEAKDHTVEKMASGGSGGVASVERTASSQESDVIAGKDGEASQVKLKQSNAIGGLGGFRAGNTSESGQSLPFANRNYFGAGGGGGGANNVVWGRGGNGAPGAVIIEW